MNGYSPTKVWVSVDTKVSVLWADAADVIVSTGRR
jgi:hypothetical protein